MPLTIREEAIKPSRREATPRDPIFKRYQDEALQRLIDPTPSKKDDPTSWPKGSLDQAIGRYGDGGVNASDKAIASYNWRRVGPGADENGKVLPKAQQTPLNERVSISVKAGSRRVPILESAKKPGKLVASIECKGEHVIPILEDMEKMLKAMTPKNEDGAIFHLEAKKAAMPKFKKGLEKPFSYSPSEDQWIIHKSEKDAKDWRAANPDYQVKTDYFPEKK